MLSINWDCYTLGHEAFAQDVSVAIMALSSALLPSLPLSLNLNWAERHCYLQIPLKNLLYEFEKESGVVTLSTPIYLENRNPISIK